MMSRFSFNKLFFVTPLAVGCSDAEAGRAVHIIGAVCLILAIFLALETYHAVVNYRKNRKLSKFISENLNLEEKERIAARPAPETPGKGASDEAVYNFLSREIREKELFLSPTFGRQTLLDSYPLNKEHIGSAFSSAGTSLPAFVTGCRLEYACRLMEEDPTKSMEEISAQSGFTSRISFTRSFKQKYGLTPTEYRRGREEE